MKCLLAAATALAATSALAQSAPPNVDKHQLDQYEAAYKAAKTNLGKHPKDAGAKQKFVASTDRYATAMMTSEAVPARLRYPQALGLYQEVLRVEPKNAEASNNSSMVDSVYKSMIAKNRKALKANPKDTKAKAELKRLEDIYRNIHRPIPG